MSAMVLTQAPSGQPSVPLQMFTKDSNSQRSLKKRMGLLLASLFL